MTHRSHYVILSMLATGLALTLSCVRTTVRPPPALGRMEALSGLDAVNEVLARQTGSCVVIFHSPRSAACRGMLHSFREVLPELGPNAVIYTANIDNDPLLAPAMGVGSVPVAVFLREGAEVDRWIAYRPPAMIRAPLQRFFAP